VTPAAQATARPASRTVRDTRRHAVERAVAYLSLLGLGVSFAFPFLWTLSSSLKTGPETHLFPPLLLPEVPQWVNYARIWAVQPLGRWLFNSTFVVAASVPGAVLSASLVAYSFARFAYPGRDFFFLVLLSTMMIPFEVTMIPQYLLFHRLGWLNTFAPLVVPSWAGGGAFTVFLLRQFLLTIPRDLDEAALMDGANSFQILWRIILPLARPALATVAILQFLGHWNDFLGPFIYLSKRELFTMAVGLRYFQTLPDLLREPKEHLLMTATIIMTLPAIALFFAAQRYFVRGIVMSGLKL
jgi:ABC-type glycerol-3-phosphate transport system permease component